jgi:hypothetical protein
MDRQQMDQQVDQILQQVRQRIVEQALSAAAFAARSHSRAVSPVFVLWMTLVRISGVTPVRWAIAIGIERLLRVRCSLKDGRYWRLFGKWPDDLAVWQVRRKRSKRAA